MLDIGWVKLKWSTESGHRIKAVKCHSEVNDDNRDEKETGLYGRLQAGCGGPGDRAGLQGFRGGAEPGDLRKKFRVSG